MDGEVKERLRSAIQQLGLSARAYHRILKLSRTIADLAGAAEIGVPHVAGRGRRRRGAGPRGWADDPVSDAGPQAVGVRREKEARDQCPSHGKTMRSG